MLEIYPASGLRFVEEGFRQKTYGNNFVARGIKKSRPRHVGGALRLAFAAAQTVFDGIADCLQFRLLHDKGFCREKVKAWCVGVFKP